MVQAYGEEPTGPARAHGSADHARRGKGDCAFGDIGALIRTEFRGTWCDFADFRIWHSTCSFGFCREHDSRTRIESRREVPGEV